MSLTTLPPMMRSPLVCCSSPQMMRKKVVLPQPDGPSKTMNSPSGTVSVIPLTADTSPNFLMISLVSTAAIEAPEIKMTFGSPSPDAPHTHLLQTPHPAPDRAQDTIRTLLRPLKPFVENAFALLRGPLNRVFGAHCAGRGLRHHVANDEVVVDFVRRGPGRPRIIRHCGPLIRRLQNHEIVVW